MTILQRMRKIKPFKLSDVTRILNPEERQQMMAGAVNRILAAESEFIGYFRVVLSLIIKARLRALV